MTESERRKKPFSPLKTIILAVFYRYTQTTRKRALSSLNLKYKKTLDNRQENEYNVNEQGRNWYWQLARVTTNNNRPQSEPEGDYFFMRIVTVPFEETETEETTPSCKRYSKKSMYSTLIKEPPYVRMIYIKSFSLLSEANRHRSPCSPAIKRSFILAQPRREVKRGTTSSRFKVVIRNTTPRRR